MPDEPTGSPAPARRRRGLPPRASALVVIAFTLLVVSGVVYVQSIPSLLPAGDPGAPAAGGEEPTESNQGQASAGEDAGAQGDQAAPGTGPGTGADAEKLVLPDVTLEGAHVEEQPAADDPEAEDPKPDAPAADDPKPPANDAPSGDAGDDAPDAGDDNIFTSDPSAEEEASFRAFLAGKASAIPGYVSQANTCASAFERDCQSAGLSARRADRGTCASLTQQLFSEYIAVRDYVRSNNSQYCDEQERLVGAYRCLMSYVDCYLDAWDINVSFEDPSGHVGEFTAPLDACDGYLAEFHSYYDGFTI